MKTLQPQTIILYGNLSEKTQIVKLLQHKIPYVENSKHFTKQILPRIWYYVISY